MGRCRAVVGGLAGVVQGAGVAIPQADKSSPAHINDPDMMVIGLGWNEFVRTPRRCRSGQANSTSTARSRAHFSLWAMPAAPLLTGNDVRTMSPQTLDILTNRDVIAVDQDPLVAQGHPLDSDPRVWVKPLADGAVAVALTNAGNDAGDVGTTAAAVGLSSHGCYRVRDLWTHTESDSSEAIGPYRFRHRRGRCSG